MRVIPGKHQVSRNRGKAVAALVALTTSLLASLVIQPASATIGTNDYPYKNDSPSQADPWGFYKRECVSFVAWRMNNDNHVAFTNNMKGPNGVTGHWGNAYQWDNAARIGYSHNAVPARGSIAWYAQNYHGAGPYGHVAYVEALNPDGSIVVEEYNARARPYDHTYGKRTLRPGSTSWPSEFLHVKDLTPPPPPPPPRASGDGTATVRADFNGDGRDDVLVVSPRGPSGLNFVPLLSTGTAFTHGGLWWNTGTDYTLDVVRLVAGDFNGDGRSDVLLVTPRGPSGLNFVPLLSNGSAFTYGGLWFNTGTELSLDVLRLAAGDFNGDGRSDVLAVTPRGPSGLNFWPLLSTGSAFTHGDLWYNTGTELTLDVLKLAAGDFNADGNDDVLLATPRGPSGLNFVPLLSNGTSAFVHGGLWFNTGTELTLDVLKLASGDFNGDGKGDVLLVTPRGPSGLNFVPLLSDGSSAFVHGGLWFNTGTELTLDVLKLAAGDFNADRRGDVLLVTPRGPSGLNFVPLQSTGTAFSYGGLWFNTGTDYAFDQIKLA